MSSIFLSNSVNVCAQALANSPNFEEAVKLLAYTPTAAPVYYIIGGAGAGEGAIITKGRLEPDDIWMIDPENGTYVSRLIQVKNYVHAFERG